MSCMNSSPASSSRLLCALFLVYRINHWHYIMSDFRFDSFVFFVLTLAWLSMTCDMSSLFHHFFVLAKDGSRWSSLRKIGLLFNVKKQKDVSACDVPEMVISFVCLFCHDDRLDVQLFPSNARVRCPSRIVQKLLRDGLLFIEAKLTSKTLAAPGAFSEDNICFLPTQWPPLSSIGPRENKMQPILAILDDSSEPVNHQDVDLPHHHLALFHRPAVHRESSFRPIELFPPFPVHSHQSPN